MANRKIHLVIIDPQNDFCDLPEDYRPFASTVPALPVAGVHADMQRIAALIERGGDGLSAITVTLDSHQRIDIAHPTFWCRGDGSAVAPFTPISAADVAAGRYRPRLAEALPRVQAYLEALEANGRYLHMVWPVHCEIGSWGHNVHDDVRRAYNGWEEARVAIVSKVLKGSNPWTEHYSALKAEVPLADDPATQLNVALVDRLRQADRVLIAGEAGSHCVKATTEHLVDNFAAADLGKLVLLTDCMSPVAGFEAQYAGFLADMQRRGVQLATSAEILPELLANC
ncbi:MAG: cysteine hydrolase [Dechloromonas sp.]|nr:cysteine hydrolase [Dechloromonas sp.]